jgi:O-antigen ligase
MRSAAKFLSVVRVSLLLACAFFASWGPLTGVFGDVLSASRLFVAGAIAMILYWLLLCPRRFEPFPRFYNLFILLVVVHTIVTYCFVHRGELDFSVQDFSSVDETVVGLDEGRGTYVARYFLYVLYAYAMARLCRTRRDFRAVPLLLGVGLLVSMLLGDRSSISRGEGMYRLTGGFLNPNDMGNTAMVIVLLNLYVLRVSRSRLLVRALALLLSGVGLYALFASASRSALIALCIGVMVMLYYSSLAKKIRTLGVLALVVTAVALYLPEESVETIEGRVSIDTLQQTRGSMRIDIYSDYLRQFPSYALAGVGLKRSVEAVKDTYTTHHVLIPHNGYLEVLVEFGCPGLLLFLLSLVQFWRRLAIRHGERPADRAADSVMLGLLAAWAVYFLMASAGSRIFWISWAILASYGFVRSRDMMAESQSSTLQESAGEEKQPQ